MNTLQEEEIKVQNMAVELTYLLAAIPERASELSVLHKQIEKAKSDLAAFKEQQSLDRAEMATEKEQLQAMRNDIQAQQFGLDLARKNQDKDLEDSKLKVREAVKELAWVNDKVFKAKGELIDIEKEKKELELKVAEIIVLIGRSEEIKLDISILEATKGEILKELTDAKRLSDESLNEAELRLKTLTSELAVKEEQAKDAKYRLKTYTDQLYTAINDYQIIRERLERKWNETFPELELPLM